MDADTRRLVRLGMALTGEGEDAFLARAVRARVDALMQGPDPAVVTSDAVTTSTTVSAAVLAADADSVNGTSHRNTVGDVSTPGDAGSATNGSDPGAGAKGRTKKPQTEAQRKALEKARAQAAKNRRDREGGKKTPSSSQRATKNPSRLDPVKPPEGCMNITTPDDRVFGAIVYLVQDDPAETLYTASELASGVDYVGGQGAAYRGGAALFQRLRNASVPYAKGEGEPSRFRQSDLMEYLVPVDEQV